MEIEGGKRRYVSCSYLVDVNCVRLFLCDEVASDGGDVVGEVEIKWRSSRRELQDLIFKSEKLEPVPTPLNWDAFVLRISPFAVTIFFSRLISAATFFCGLSGRRSARRVSSFRPRHRHFFPLKGP